MYNNVSFKFKTMCCTILSCIDFPTCLHIPLTIMQCIVLNLIDTLLNIFFFLLEFSFTTIHEA